ncbi:uroporphyrinogen-III C-methyltransferase [Sphingobacterium bambusae]|uniref:uroporphyrinogen-III C-methyltransferase n=1 Tax=Sphingobacterium bambusae TaxID=662858 RepID=A0ABW6BDS8_9SPHI|nr:uroporphyrinogen-III C-methyltransferase [Sphingobacterium bambusae]WPL48835.1 uroporphyrinogen-III C-methyltransferase [Sphingobacterium bambusae]
MTGKLFIIGCGPGNPDLLTIKAYNTIIRAEIVLFDNLVSQEILDLCPKNCKKIYVGKDPYGQYVPQADINSLIGHYCHHYATVLRLKGGDPYIFGRGFEERLYANTLGIATEYIPGISSMQGAGSNDIPLTHRGVSEGVWIMTGTKSNGELTADLALAAQSNATVIIYMGMRKVAEIAGTYVRLGKGDTPAAMIQNATCPNEKSVSCLVKDLQITSLQQQIHHPAIIIIGAVVDLKLHIHTELQHLGKRII